MHIESATANPAEAEQQEVQSHAKTDRRLVAPKYPITPQTLPPLPAHAWSAIKPLRYAWSIKHKEEYMVSEKVHVKESYCSQVRAVGSLFTLGKTAQNSVELY